MTRAKTTPSQAPAPTPAPRAAKSKGPAKGTKAWHESKADARAAIDFADAQQSSGVVESPVDDTDIIDE
jgi:hypothetical protein